MKFSPRKVGQPSVLINNAGARIVGAVEELSEEEIRWQIEVNFFGAVSLTNYFLPYMRENQRGTIINISSLLGITGRPYSAFYAASKHALGGYTKSLRYEVRSFGINVSLLQVGYANTPLFLHARSAKTSLPAYANSRENLFGYRKKLADGGFDAYRVAQTVEKIIKASHPHLVYSRFDDPISKITSRLPNFILERLIAYKMRP